MATEIVKTCLPIHPWLRDHCFNNQTILPAVEAIRLLASTVQAMYPAVNVQVMKEARFTKFLELPPNQDEINIQVEVTEVTGGRVQAHLLTRKQLKAMKRLTGHCELLFGGGSEGSTAPTQPPTTGTDPVFEVSADRIYRELVPFGPMYRTLHGQIHLGQDSALGRLHTPNLPVDFPPIGSPFSLDGAMHAACVHGQRMVDFVPFPVGFTTRIVTLPTLPDEEYIIRADLRSLVEDELVYDLLILDHGDRIRETLFGLRMRDVTGGRIKPPPWIQARPEQRQRILAEDGP
jgi:hypothetical protein